MPSSTILLEVDRLHDVCGRLDTLAEQHPTMSEALMVITGNIRQTATLLQILVVTKMSQASGTDIASA
jgi:hypothetical protein